MKALVGVDTLTDLAPSDVISEMERLADTALLMNGAIQEVCTFCGGQGTVEVSREMAIDAGDANRTGEKVMCWFCGGDGYKLVMALTECEHGVHVDDPCDICDPESALEAQNQAEECSDMDVFHRY